MTNERRSARLVAALLILVAVCAAAVVLLDSGEIAPELEGWSDGTAPAAEGEEARREPAGGAARARAGATDDAEAGRVASPRSGPPAATLTGRLVWRQDASPVVGAVVGADGRTTTTDEDGRFSLALGRGRPRDVALAVRGWDESPTLAWRPDRADVGEIAVARAEVPVRFVFRDREGRPVAGARVAPGWFGHQPSPPADADGRLTTGVIVPEARLHAGAPGHALAALGLDAQPRDEVAVVLAALPALEVELDAAPAAEIRIGLTALVGPSLFPTAGGGRENELVMPATSRFELGEGLAFALAPGTTTARFPGIVAERVRVELLDAFHHRLDSRDVPVRGDLVRVTFPTPQVRAVHVAVRVVDEKGAALAEAPVELSGSAGARTAVTDAGGLANFEAVPAGHAYQAKVLTETHVGLADLTVAIDPTVVEVRALARERASVSFRDPGGVAVDVENPLYEGVAIARVGRGSYEVLLDPTSPSRLSFTVGGRRSEITLERNAVVEVPRTVTLRLEIGAPRLAGSELIVRTEGEGSETVHRVRLDAGGAAALDVPVLPGRRFLTVQRASGDVPGEPPIWSRDLGPVDADLVLPVAF